MDERTLAEAISANTAAVRALTAAITEQLSTAAHARAARGSELGSAVGTGIAFVNVKERKEDYVRSFVNEEEPTNERTKSFSWERLTEDNTEVDTGPVRFLCDRIREIVKCKPGKYWRNDRRLVVVAAVLATRIDALSADGQAGTRWLNAALELVQEFRPVNSAAYFQSIIKKGLGDIDPVMQDPGTVGLLWIQLTKRIQVPEKWLAERPQRLRQASEG